jgi:hypothetical protein
MKKIGLFIMAVITGVSGKPGYKNATEMTKSTGSFVLAATYHF